MIEKQKMLSGELYNPLDEELSKERSILKNKIRLLNQMNRDSNEYYEMLKSIIGYMGENSFIEAPFFCDYGYNIHLGNNFYANMNLTILDCAKVTFGNNVLVGPNVSILTPIHPTAAKKRSTFLEYAKPVVIENDVWIAGNVTIIGGVTVGARSIIGAGSVVTRDIPQDVFAAGNPCKVIKQIDNEQEL